LDFSFTGLSPSLADLSRSLQLNPLVPYRGPATPRYMYRGLGSSRFARHYSGNRYYFLFLRLLRCFSSPGCLPLRDAAVLTAAGFPIRKSPDQSYFDSSPGHIAANRVLHRLAVPRYPLRAAVTQSFLDARINSYPDVIRNL
jgi:hypothetical protein